LIVRSKLGWTLLAGVVFLISFSLFWIVRARRALEQAEVDSATSRIAFQIRSISNSKPTAVDFPPLPPDFRDMQLFQDLLYICGSGGIWAYDLAGDLRAAFLVGRDLPPSPPVTMVVGAIAGDARPKLWIATAGAGILAFDGARFSQIHLQGKGYGNATSLLMLPTGVLLVGLSEGGVFAYDGAAITAFHPTLRNIPVTALAGNEGDLWIGTRNRGVVHWRAGSTEEFQDPQQLPDNRVLCITSAENRVFVGTPLGIAEFREGRHVRNIAEGTLSQTLLATHDRLLIGTFDEGIVEVKLTSESGRRPFARSDLQPHTARRLFEIRGTSFALTRDSLFEQDSRTGLWTMRIGKPHALWADRNASALSVDQRGRLWIGYFDRGIDIADVDDMQQTLHIEDDQVFCINRIVSDPERNVLMVASANGLLLFSPQGKILRRLTQSDGLISNQVTDVAVRRDGLAIATAAGVTFMDTAGTAPTESIYAFHGLANNHVYALGVSGSRLLAGTLGGLSLIQDGFVRASYTTTNSPLKQNWISAVVPFGDTAFVGTYGGGVLQLNRDGDWTNFSDIPPNVVINPNAMLAVANRVVAGTLDRGLLVYDPASFRWTSLTEGLPSLNVTAVAASAGKLFVGTDNGVIRMPVEALGQTEKVRQEVETVAPWRRGL
jgi:hypothetical protein